MNPPRTVAVIGLGTIGGSVARGLALRGCEVLAHDANASFLDAAIDEGVISRRLSPDLSDVNRADAVVIAVGVDSTLEVLAQLGAHPQDFSLVTDVGSTKRTIVAGAERSSLARCFVGSHPFAGDQRSGWPASRSDLFEGETVYICPTRASTDEALASAEALWRLLGAEPVRIDATSHDKLLAWTSHLPHMMSTALALALGKAGIEWESLGRGGRDVVRLAAGSPDIWTAIGLDNAAEIELALEGLEHQLSHLRELLRSNDRVAVRALLARAQAWSGFERS